MNSKNLFIFNSLTCILFGLPLFIIPTGMLGQYMMPDHTITPLVKLMTQAYGAMLIMVGVILWIAREVDYLSVARKALLWAVLVGNVLALFVWISGYSGGLINQMIFGSFVIISITALWAAVLLFKKEKQVVSITT